MAVGYESEAFQYHLCDCVPIVLVLSGQWLQIVCICDLDLQLGLTVDSSCSRIANSR